MNFMQSLDFIFILRFTVFVHGAIADAPKLEPTSFGRVAYQKQLAQERADICRRIFESDDPLVAKCRMMQMLQFPELRLIEYDCGNRHLLNLLLTNSHRMQILGRFFFTRAIKCEWESWYLKAFC